MLPVKLFAFTFILFGSLFANIRSFGKTIVIESQAGFDKVKSNLQPGDTLVFAGGNWKNAALVFTANGSVQAPIVLMPSRPGEVIFSEQSSIRFGGSHIIITGFVFRGVTTTKTAIIEYRSSKNELAFDSRVSNCVFDNCNPPDRLSESHWVTIYGQRNRFDHNELVGKLNLGTTLIVELNDKNNQQNHHRIDHNYFGQRERLGSNGGETIRIGNSTFSKSSSQTVVEENLFDRCNGEVEIVSVKSSDNILRKNTFLNCEGSLVLRHGDRNLVEDNAFLGNGKMLTGGVRIINAGHIIRNNLFYASAGDRFRAALTVLNGVPNSPLNRYDQVKDVLVEGNLFVDCNNIALCAGKDLERTARPERIKFNSNVIYSDTTITAIGVYDSLDGFAFSANYTNSKVSYPAGSFRRADIQVKRITEAFVLRQNGKERKFSIAATIANTGVQWGYKKSSAISASPNTIKVLPGENSLSKAIANAAAHDVLVLQAGATYNVSQAAVISLPVSVVGNGAVLAFAGERSVNFFEIENGGSLRLQGVTMKGMSENGSAGSFIVAGTKPMIEHYNLWVSDCVFSNLTGSRKQVLDGGKGSYADSIVFTNCIFDEITGDAINLAAEKDDVGRYNVENLVFNNCLFNKILYGCINVYRGGNDESTTGPYVTINQCTFNESSNTELGYALKLYGVQYSSITNSVFNNSGRAGRSVWYEDFGWTEHRIDQSDFYEAGRVTSFYDGIVSKNNYQLNPMLSPSMVVTNTTLISKYSNNFFPGYKPQ